MLPEREENCDLLTLELHLLYISILRFCAGTVWVQYSLMHRAWMVWKRKSSKCICTGNPSSPLYIINMCICMASSRGWVKPCFFAFSRAFIKHTKVYKGHTGKLKEDIRNSQLYQDLPNDWSMLLHCYNTTLRSLLDAHGPVCSRHVSSRPRPPWFN